MKYGAFFLVILLAASLFVPVLGGRVLADSFNQNNIISDIVFDKAGSMLPAQIDSFLNQFPSSCISTGHGFSAPDPTGYSPSGGFTYGGNVSAGQVIYDAAQAYGLNPQVLLATLQKEQSLVTGGGGCSVLAYAAAVGYGCPDSGTTHNYSGIDLYSINGTMVTSVNGTCVNTASKAGFSQQVIRGAWLLKFGEQRSEGNVGWAVIKGNWNNSDDPQSCYGGPMTQGNFQRCPGGSSVYYDGYSTIDGVSVHMDDGATAALYWYTPHFSGNQHFFTIFTGWFGSTHYFGNKAASSSVYAHQPCTVGNFSNLSVARLYEPDTDDYLYTTNNVEVCYAITLGYIYDGLTLQGVASSDPNAVPVYRISGFGRHVFTASASQRSSLLAQAGYSDEGIGWYDYGSQVAGSQPVMGFSNSAGGSFLSAAIGEANAAPSAYGYTANGAAFYEPLSGAAPGTASVYRLAKNNVRFYTSNSLERDIAVNNYGYTYEGVLSNGDVSPNQNNIPIYRVRTANGYLYTTSRDERDLAVINYNYLDEGINFYDLGWSSTPIYRLTNYLNGLRFFTNNSGEESQAVSRYGYNYEGPSWYGY